MKKKFLTFAMKSITANNDFDETKLAELKYGLESFYMLSTKIIILLFIAFLFGLFKELLLFLLFYTPLRSMGFGFHANNNTECWLITVPMFLLLPYIAKTFSFNILIIQSLIIIATVIFLFFAPADTKKKPLVNTKKRLINKCLIVTISLLYLFLSIVIKNNLIINLLMLTCIWQAICVCPLTYKLFNQPFNNYKTYLKEV